MDEQEAARSKIEQRAAARAATEQAERAAGGTSGELEQIALARATGPPSQVGDALCRRLVAGPLGSCRLLGQAAQHGLRRTAAAHAGSASPGALRCKPSPQCFLLAPSFLLAA